MVYLSHYFVLEFLKCGVFEKRILPFGLKVIWVSIATAVTLRRSGSPLTKYVVFSVWIMQRIFIRYLKINFWYFLWFHHRCSFSRSPFCCGFQILSSPATGSSMCCCHRLQFDYCWSSRGFPCPTGMVGADGSAELTELRITGPLEKKYR